MPVFSWCGASSSCCRSPTLARNCESVVYFSRMCLCLPVTDQYFWLQSISKKKIIISPISSCDLNCGCKKLGQVRESMMSSQDGKWLGASALAETSEKPWASSKKRGDNSGNQQSDDWKTKARSQRTSVSRQSFFFCTCRLVQASEEMRGVRLLPFWVPVLLMSLSGPVSKARPACVPSRPQTAVISPVMACHRARLAWHAGEISNIHLLWLLQAAFPWGIHLAVILASHLTSLTRKERGEKKWSFVCVQQ